MPGRIYDPEAAGNFAGSKTYRYGFNGQDGDNDEAFGGVTDHYTAEFWEYDARIGRRFNLDPRPNISVSSYATFENNPIWASDVLGDTVIVNSKGYILKNEQADKLVYMKGDDNKLSLLGKLGETIDANVIFKNLLKENSNTAKKITWISWVNYVKKDGSWDLKDTNEDNKKISKSEYTIFGVAWLYDQKEKTKQQTSSTTFIYEGNLMDGADLGNYHAGYTGTTVGIPFYLQKLGAGAVESMKNGNTLILCPGDCSFWSSFIWSEPHGDALEDYKWNTKGMKDSYNDWWNQRTDPRERKKPERSRYQGRF